MKQIIIVLSLFVAGCAGGQIDPSQLTPPPAWALAQERDIAKPKEGEDLVEHYNQCYVKVGRVRDKHAITSRWIKNVIGSK